MKFLWILAASALAAAGAGHAEPLTLRSGDHPTFSRITIPLPASQQWEAKRTNQGIEIKLPGFAQGFDISGVFSRMRPDHIAALDALPDKLTLRVDCNCIATVFRSGSLLVIDVAIEGTQLVGSLIENTAPSEETQSPAMARQFTPATPLPWIGGNSPFGATVPPGNGTVANHSTSTSIPLPDERTELLEEMQSKLIERVASATSIGLLESSYEKVVNVPGEVNHPPQSTSNLEPEELPEAIQAPSRNIRISSSMDLPIGTSIADQSATSNGIACPKDSLLAIETWGNETSFSTQVGPARNGLMNARDILDKNAATELAQLFIYFGFGAEALDALRLDPSLAVEQAQLAAIATIFEHGAVPRPNVLSQYTDCSSNIALWATLSFQDIPNGTLIDTDATLRALNKLPKHLRQLVAPALSDRLLKYGDSSAAAAAMRSIERLSDPLTSDALMSQASLAIGAGKPAESVLEHVIEANSAQSPAALIKLVDGKLADNEPLSTETATLVEAYVQELRGTEMGNKLRQTQVIALSQSQRFDDAFDVLEEIAPSMSPEASNSLKQTIVEQLTENADDLTFLERAFATNAEELDLLPSKTRLAIAQRMIDLGFAAKAQQVLATLAETHRSNERQILAARAALLLRQPFQAQAALIGAEGREVSLLLAQAKEQSGAYREASELFAISSSDSQASQAAWLSDDWSELLTENTPGLGPITSLVQSKTDDQSTDLGPLARASLALEESAVARDTLVQLLRDPVVQIAPDS